MRARALVFLCLFFGSSQCQSKSQETNGQKDSSSVMFVVSFLITLSLIIFASGQLVVGGSSGWGRSDNLSFVEIFPPTRAPYRAPTPDGNCHFFNRSLIKSTSADKRVISAHTQQLRFTKNHASLCPLVPLYLFSTDSRPK